MSDTIQYELIHDGPKSLKTRKTLIGAVVLVFGVALLACLSTFDQPTPSDSVKFNFFPFGRPKQQATRAPISEGLRSGSLERSGLFMSSNPEIFLSAPSRSNIYVDKFSPRQVAIGSAYATEWDTYGRPPLTKIIATIGPASESEEIIHRCVQTGMRVMRINFSHATPKTADQLVQRLRSAPGWHTHTSQSSFNTRAIMLDTKGPEIRTGALKIVKDTGDKTATVVLEQGQTIILNCDPNSDSRELGDESMVFVTYEQLPKTVSAGSPVLLDDGLIKLTVLSVNGAQVLCRVENTGKLGERKGVNLPGSKVLLPALSTKDKEDIAYGVAADLDFVAASFVRTANDVREIRAFIAQEHSKHFPDSHPQPRIIAKIESTEALDNFDEILAEADAIMVARGDLGVEIPLEQVTIAQKQIINKCRRFGKPVIVATQLLESMINNPRPTRAEVSDVTNAIVDGADAVMLSGESAKGKYPVESIATLRAIIHATEHSHQTMPLLIHSDLSASLFADVTTTDALATGAVVLAEQIHASAIVITTKTGATAQVLSKYRPSMPILCLCQSAKVARSLALHRGLHSIMRPELEPGTKELTDAQISELLKGMSLAAAGESVIVVNSEEDSETIRVVKVKQ